MKHIFVLGILLISMNIFGQTPERKTNWLKIPRTDIKVTYTNGGNDKQPIGYFLNGIFLSDFSLLNIDPENIDSLNIINEDFQIDSINYQGKILITTKPGYNPDFISLNDLRDKFTNLKNKATAFMIDGNIVNADYENYFIDENYVLQIIVDNIKNIKENIDLGFIKILTRTKENIEKSKEKFIQ